MQSDLIVVIPVYNDWESLHVLLQEIEKNIIDAYSRQYIIVNDSSEIEPELSSFPKLNCPITLIEAYRNMGHQKAIAAGLAYVNENWKGDYCVVMDSDGEDRPSDIDILLDKSKETGTVIFAQRAKRSEGSWFKFFYKFYKLLFLLLTGKKINFGNFCIIPERHLRKIVHVPDIWNHFSGGIIRSGIPYKAVATG